MSQADAQSSSSTTMTQEHHTNRDSNDFTAVVHGSQHELSLPDPGIHGFPEPSEDLPFEPAGSSLGHNLMEGVHYDQARCASSDHPYTLHPAVPFYVVGNENVFQLHPSEPGPAFLETNGSSQEPSPEDISGEKKEAVISASPFHPMEESVPPDAVVPHSSKSAISEQDAVTADTDGKSDQGSWNQLPDLVLLEIFRNLDDYNRLQFGLTCKRAHTVFQSACLWRRRRIDLTFPRQAENKAVQFARCHAKHLHYLTVYCRHPSFTSCKRFQTAITNFFSTFTGETRLRTLKISQLELERYWRYVVLKDKLITSIIKFLRTQRYLKAFDMSAAQVNLASGCRILEAVSEQNGENVVSLNLEDFFHSRVSAFRVHRFVNIIRRFVSLETLALNYNCISDELLGIIGSNCSGALKKFSVKVYKNDPHVHRISPTAWRRFKRRCSGIRVDMEFDQVPKYEDISPILVPDVPLHKLHIWSGFVDDIEWRTGDLLLYVTENFNSTLNTLTIEVDNNHEEIDNAIVHLVKRCPKLRSLDINAIVGVCPTIEQICELRAQDKCELNKFHVTVCGATDVDIFEINSVEDKYQEMIDSRALDFQFTADVHIVHEDNDEVDVEE